MDLFLCSSDSDTVSVSPSLYSMSHCRRTPVTGHVHASCLCTLAAAALRLVLQQKQLVRSPVAFVVLDIINESHHTVSTCLGSSLRTVHISKKRIRLQTDLLCSCCCMSYCLHPCHTLKNTQTHMDLSPCDLRTGLLPRNVLLTAQTSAN